MCTYNGARYLPAQLDSIAAQSQPPHELVVCDDGSTDATPDLLAQFAETMPFPVRVILNERRLGSTDNFAQAIGLCSGHAIALADQDDVWPPTKLAAYEAVFTRAPYVGGIFADAEIVDAELRPLGYNLWQYLGFNSREQRRVRAGDAFEVLLRHDVVLGATLAFRAALRDLVLPIPLPWAHDRWIPLLLAAATHLAALPRPLIHYRQHVAQQFGAPPRTLRGQIARVRGADRARYAALADQYAAARERVLAAGVLRPGSRRLARLEAKIAHFRARAAMPRQPLLRLPWVVRELAGRRYHRYAGGWTSVATDLVF
jgi:glycosyltransferase involved in cell wall biosynthesis